MNFDVSSGETGYYFSSFEKLLNLLDGGNIDFTNLK